MDYDAFGLTLNRTGSTQTNYLFAGEARDEESGHYYLRARYYDPSRPGFTQMDSWMGINSDPITLHKYLYANADPVNFIDPSGNISISGVMNGIGVAASLATAATTGHDIGTSLYGHFSGEEPIEINKASVKQIGFAAMFSVGGGKALKLLSKNKRFKKYLKRRVLFRGVSSEHRDPEAYSNAKRGFVAGGIRGLFMSSSERDTAAGLHNAEKEFNTPFSSWSARRSIAKDFATHRGITKGVVIKANIMSFRIFKSPNKFNEGEFLVVGPVWGKPTIVK